MQRLSIGILLLLYVSPLIAASHCVILQYHHFSDQTPAVTSVTPVQFDAHLDYLKEEKIHVLPLRDVVTALKNDVPLPDPCVSLTVDDAYRSVYEAAYPRLKKLGWPLTVFVNTRAIDDGISSYMTWSQMREMSGHGVQFENHSHGHDHLIRRQQGEDQDAWEQRVARDILIAQGRITQEIGVRPVLFAHPYGEYDQGLLDILKSMGLVGFGQQSGPAWSGADPGALPRFPMAAGYADMSGFKTKVNSLPFLLEKVTPTEPLVPLDEWRPELILAFQPETIRQESLRCYVNGSDDVDLDWSKWNANQLVVRPRQKLHVGRNRYNCTMRAEQAIGTTQAVHSNASVRFHWYSHNWIRRHADGRWYSE